MTRVLAALPGLALLTGCGVSVRVSTHIRTTTTSATHQPGDRTFSYRGMAIHFRYPGTVSSAAINHVGRKTQSSLKVTRAALTVGDGGYDLLTVTRYAQIVPPVSAGNIASEKRGYDRELSNIFSRPMVASVSTVGGLPAFRYPDAPTPGVPVSAITRATFVFTGHDEYELQCQWTPAQRGAVINACDEMLRTLHT